MRNLSGNFEGAAFAQETGEALIWLLEISHPDLSSTIYVSGDSTQDLPIAGVRGTVSNGQEYVYLPFEIKLAEQTDTLVPKATIRIDNISREILQSVREASGEPPSVVLKLVLASDTDTVEAELDGLRLNNVKADAFTVQADLQPQMFATEAFPQTTFNQADFPGIFG